MKFYIPRGSTWAHPLYKRIHYNTPPVTFDRKPTWTCKVDMKTCPTRTSIKLVGTIEGRLTSFQRVKNNGWNDLLNIGHEDSDRIVCTKTRNNKISISAYAYRGGVGAVSDSKLREQAPILHKRIGVVDHGETFQVSLELFDDVTVYHVYLVEKTKSLGSVKIERNDSLSPFRFRSFAHAAGAHGPVAPEHIELEIS